MRIRFPQLTKRQRWFLAVTLVGVVCIVATFLSRNWWVPKASQLLGSVQERLQGSEGSQNAALGKNDEAEVHAADAGQAEATSLQLSEQGQKNIGLRLVTVEPRDFDRTIRVPAMVVERPGRTEIKVSALMTGIVTRVYPIRGEAVTPGEPLFRLRLTHEDLVQAQSEFLQTVEGLDVIKKEVSRIEKVTSSGAVAGKRLLERQYEQQKTEALLRAQQEALILHGLTQEHVNEIMTKRRLVRELTIVAPPAIDCESRGEHKEFLQVAEFGVTPGEHVTAGTRLCTLSDHCELYIEGRAFEQDADTLNKAISEGTLLTAIVEGSGSGRHEIPGLRILYVGAEVELESRALRFYVRLPNELIRNEKTPDGHRFIGWRYKPGQRVQLLVPVERWENRIVLPVDAVVEEGAEWFVFQQNGDHFDRKPVHVEYRDQLWAVLGNDGSLFPGDVVAASGAYQIHLAMKNKAGGGVDPHAGHNH